MVNSDVWYPLLAKVKFSKIVHRAPIAILVAKAGFRGLFISRVIAVLLILLKSNNFQGSFREELVYVASKKLVRHSNEEEETCAYPCAGGFREIEST